eukprot:128635_1
MAWSLISLLISIILPHVIFASYHSHLQERIVNGKPITSNQYPWMVSMRILVHIGDSIYYYGGTDHICGASLIQLHPPVIMTAAHCFDDFYVNETTGVFNRFESEYKEGFGIRFTIGATLTPDLLNLTDIYDQLTTFDPSMFHIHPQYNKSADFIPYDIALIIFDNTSTININIDPLPTIPMQLSAQESCCYPGESLIAIGFGNNQTDGSNTATLEQTTLYVLDYATAVTLLYHFSGITDDAEIRKNIAEQDEP